MLVTELRALYHVFIYSLQHQKEITVIPLISAFVRRINIVITDDVPVAYNKKFQLSWALGDGSAVLAL